MLRLYLRAGERKKKKKGSFHGAPIAHRRENACTERSQSQFQPRQSNGAAKTAASTLLLVGERTPAWRNTEEDRGGGGYTLCEKVTMALTFRRFRHPLAKLCAEPSALGRRERRAMIATLKARSLNPGLSGLATATFVRLWFARITRMPFSLALSWHTVGNNDMVDRCNAAHQTEPRAHWRENLVPVSGASGCR
ncbi:hypothetical protein MRX96_008342 [Rhipicephalus microplus]